MEVADLVEAVDSVEEVEMDSVEEGEEVRPAQSQVAHPHARRVSKLAPRSIGSKSPRPPGSAAELVVSSWVCCRRQSFAVEDEDCRRTVGAVPR